MSLGSHIVRARKDAGLGKGELARAIRVSEKTLYNYERDLTTPDTDTLRRIAEITGKSITWLTGESESAISEAVSQGKIAEDRVRLTIYEGAKVSAGDGHLVATGDEATAIEEEVSRRVLTALLGFPPPPQMQGIYVDGDSMRHRGGGILDKQLVFFIPVNDFADGRRYVMEVEDRGGLWRLLLKRVQLLTGGGLRLISDNEAAGYVSETLLPDADGDEYLVNQVTGLKTRLVVLGEVIWPRENETEETIRSVQVAFERMKAKGLI